MAVSAGSHHSFDPVQEVGDFGVDAIHVLLGAALPPAHHTRQEPGLPVLRHQRAAAVAFAGVLPAPPVPRAEHVLGDVELGVEAALLQRHPGQHQPLQVAGDGAGLHQAAPSGHGGLADVVQRPGEGAVPSREADGNDVEAQFDRAVQLQQGQVAVGGQGVVVRVDGDVQHSLTLLRLLWSLQVMFAWRRPAFRLNMVRRRCEFDLEE